MLLFDWDENNLAHIALHDVRPEEAEQVFLNDPFDISYDLIDDEERFGQAGETDAGRVLYIFWTFRGDRIRVVTCFRPTKSQVLQYLRDKRNFYE